MDDKFKIRLNLADKRYPLTIKRCEEEIVREAASRVNELINQVNDLFDGQDGMSKEDRLVLIAYQCALDYLRMTRKNDTQPYVDKIKELEKTLDKIFENEEKSSTNPNIQLP